jgi:hypothetical protein
MGIKKQNYNILPPPFLPFDCAPPLLVPCHFLQPSYLVLGMTTTITMITMTSMATMHSLNPPTLILMILLERQIWLRPQSFPNLLHRLLLPGLDPHMRQRVQQHIVIVHEEVVDQRSGLRQDDVEVALDLQAVSVEGQIVNVVAEGVLDFAADEGDAEDYVGGEQGRGDLGKLASLSSTQGKGKATYGDPAKRLEELEGQKQDVHPGDLADGNRVRDGQRRVENTVRAGQHIVHGCNRVQ